MKRALLLILFLLPAAGAAAQQGDLFLTNQRQPVQLSFSTVYQRYEDDGVLLDEISFPLALVVPLGSRLGFSMLAGGAAAGGDAVESLAGLADAQVGLSYRQPLGRGSLIATLGTNVPSGKRELTPEEFATSVLLGQNFYDFQLPTLGQGFNVAPGVTVAFPFSDALAVGAGVAYQYKGSFTPLSTSEEAYDPGDELVLTGGVDVRLGDAAALSGDVAFTLYGTDEVDGAVYYDAGNRSMATLQYLRYQGYNELRVIARYSTRARGSLPAVGGDLITEAERTVPNQGRLRVSYRLRTARTMFLGLLLQGRYYAETAAFGQKQLLDVGALPELRLTDTTSLVTRFVYTLGSFNGLEVGAGLSLEL